MEEHHAPSPDTQRQHVTQDDHTLTVEEASQLFYDAGVPRSIRTIQRYCKINHLNCISVETEMNSMYMVSTTSIDGRIKQLQQQLSQQNKSTPSGATGRDPTRQDAPRRDNDGGGDAPEATPQSSLEEVVELKKTIKNLEEKNMGLQINDRAKEQIIAQQITDRKEDRAIIIDLAGQNGKLETQLLQLKSGTEETPRPEHIIAHQTPTEEGQGDTENSHIEQFGV